MTVSELRQSPGAAWAGPLMVFLGFLLIPSLVQSDAKTAPWYLAHPEQWVYPVQTLVVLALTGFWWKHYTLRPLTRREVIPAVAAGTAGIVIWILPSWLYDRGYAGECVWLGLTSRGGGGFDPTIWSDRPAVYAGVVALRLLRMTVVVAFAEELFWRGFLWRLTSDPYRDFSQVPFAQWHWKALASTTVLFALAHSVPDRAAAVIYALIIGGLYVRTRSVGACVVAHGVSNLILGIYVLVTRQWGFW